MKTSETVSTGPKFTVSPFKNPRTGKISFRVYGMLNGKVIRENKPTQLIAFTRMQNLEREAMNMTPLPMIETRLTKEQAAESEAVFRRLAGNPHGLTMSKAVEFSLANYKPAEKQTTVTKGFELFIAAKKGKNKRGRTVANLKQRLGAFALAKGSKPVHEVQKDEVLPFIFLAHTSPANQHNQYAAFTNFFNWLVREKYRTESPLKDVEDVEVDKVPPVAFAVEQARGLVQAAASYNEGSTVPFIVLGTWCAIRPEQEMKRLSQLPKGGWEVIDLDAKVIVLGAQIAKMRKRRVVTIPDNAVEWLRPHKLARTKIFAPKKQFEAVKKLAGFCPRGQEDATGLVPWVQDYMRHTGISYHLAKHNNEGLTAGWAGNSPDVIHNDYKALITNPAHVAEFYDIRPGAAEIINLKQATRETAIAQARA